MRAARVTALLAAAVLCLGTAACEDESVSVSEPSQRQRYTLDGAGKDLRQEQVDKAVLTREDLPQGTWIEGEVEDSRVDTTGIKPDACVTWFEARNTDREQAVRAAKRTRFTRRGSTPADTVEVTSTVKSYGSPEEAGRALATLREGVAACATFTIDEKTKRDGGTALHTDGSMAPIEFERPGDDSAAMRLAMTTKATSASASQTSTSVSDTIRVQVGHNIVAVTVSSGHALDHGELKKLTDAAFRRLEAAAT